MIENIVRWALNRESHVCTNSPRDTTETTDTAGTTVTSLPKALKSPSHQGHCSHLRHQGHCRHQGHHGHCRHQSPQTLSHPPRHLATQGQAPKVLGTTQAPKTQGTRSTRVTQCTRATNLPRHPSPFHSSHPSHHRHQGHFSHPGIKDTLPSCRILRHSTNLPDSQTFDQLASHPRHLRKTHLVTHTSLVSLTRSSS